MAFRDIMVDFLFGDERQEVTFRSHKEARERWEYVEGEAVETMNDVEACLYFVYVRYTTDPSHITPLLNAGFGTSYTRTEIDDFLVPVRALVLMKYLIEEELEIIMEKWRRDNNKLPELRRVYYWRYLVDTQLNEANIARLLDWSNLDESLDGYTSDQSKSSAGQSQCSSSSTPPSLVSDESDESNDSDDSDDSEAEEKSQRGFPNPLTGTRSRNMFFPPPRLPRSWDRSDDKVSAIIHTFPYSYLDLFTYGAAAYCQNVNFYTYPAMDLLTDRLFDNFALWRCMHAFARINIHNLTYPAMGDKAFDWGWLWDWAAVLLLDEFLEDGDWVVMDRDPDDGSQRDFVIRPCGELMRIL